MRRVLRPWLVSAAALILTGCAVAPRVDTPTPEDLTELTHWQARGRLGVSGSAGGGSGTFTWAQVKDRADVHIRGPIGIGSVRLQMSGSAQDPRIQLETGDGQTFSADAAWGELESRLGASVPAGKLRYWMLGLPAPGDHQWLGEPGTDASVLEQDGWRIEYQYAGESAKRLPSRIRATGGAARVRIVVDRWSFAR